MTCVVLLALSGCGDDGTGKGTPNNGPSPDSGVTDTGDEDMGPNDEDSGGGEDSGGDEDTGPAQGDPRAGVRLHRDCHPAAYFDRDSPALQYAYHHADANSLRA